MEDSCVVSVGDDVLTVVGSRDCVVTVVIRPVSSVVDVPVVDTLVVGDDDGNAGVGGRQVVGPLGLGVGKGMFTA